jgi:osmotically inducible protein OsmC
MGESPGTNPEELIGAALAGCFSMALSLGLGQAGEAPRRVKTDARVHFEKQESGWAISRIDLTTEAEVSGIDEAAFRAIAEETKKTCPVSKALTGTEITLEARLLSSASRPT